MKIEQIVPEDCYPLRLEVLRPKGKTYEYQYPGDHREDTFHFGVMRDGKPIGIASFFANSNASIKSSNPVQLRGMATSSAARGIGAGKALVRFAIGHFREKGHDVLWCNAREGAVDFYKKLGFAVVSDRFDVPVIGPHFVMKTNLIP